MFDVCVGSFAVVDSKGGYKREMDGRPNPHYLGKLTRDVNGKVTEYDMYDGGDNPEKAKKAIGEAERAKVGTVTFEHASKRSLEEVDLMVAPNCVAIDMSHFVNRKATIQDDGSWEMIPSFQLATIGDRSNLVMLSTHDVENPEALVHLEMGKIGEDHVYGVLISGLVSPLQAFMFAIASCER